MTTDFLVGLTYVISGSLACFMFFHFLKFSGNGLKSILLHLFGAWTGKYLVIGILKILSFLLNQNILNNDILNILIILFTILKFSALIRLYFYIKKQYG